MNARPEGGRDGTPPNGQVRVLVIGDSGVGKTSLVHLIVGGRPLLKPARTVGCSISVKYVEYTNESSSNLASHSSGSGSGAASNSRGYFVELWDVSGHELYKHSRSLFYSQINGVIFVHDLSRPTSRASLRRWLDELRSHGSFSAPSLPSLPSSSSFGRPPTPAPPTPTTPSSSSSPAAPPPPLPVPLLVIANKADAPVRDPLVKHKAKLLEAANRSKTLERARVWASRHRLLSFPSELPAYSSASAPPVGLVATAREGRVDMAAINSFFALLIKRRYFTEHVRSMSPSVSLWALSGGGGAADGPASPPPFHLAPNGSASDLDAFDGSPRVDIDELSRKLTAAHPQPAMRRLSPPSSPSPEEPLSQSDTSPAVIAPLKLSPAAVAMTSAPTLSSLSLSPVPLSLSSPPDNARASPGGRAPSARPHSDSHPALENRSNAFPDWRPTALTLDSDYGNSGGTDSTGSSGGGGGGGGGATEGAFAGRRGGTSPSNGSVRGMAPNSEQHGNELAAYATSSPSPRGGGVHQRVLLSPTSDFARSLETTYANPPQPLRNAHPHPSFVGYARASHPVFRAGQGASSAAPHGALSRAQGSRTGEKEEGKTK